MRHVQEQKKAHFWACRWYARKHLIATRFFVVRTRNGFWGSLVITMRGLCIATVGCTPKGSCNNTLLRRALRRLSNSLVLLLEGFLEGTCKGFEFSKDKVLGRVLRGERLIEGAQKVLRRQKPILSQKYDPLRVHPEQIAVDRAITVHF